MNWKCGQELKLTEIAEEESRESYIALWSN